MDIFGFKKRAIKKAIKEHLDQCKKRKETTKYIRNTERLKEWMREKRLKGVELLQNYLENEGLPPPKTQKECDLLIKVLKDVAQ